MIREALINDDNVTVSNEQGILSERENTPFIEDIIKCENEIEIIDNQIKDNDVNNYIINENMNSFKQSIKIIFGTYTSIFLFSLLGYKTGFFPHFIYTSTCYLSIVFAGCELIPIIGLFNAKKDNRKFLVEKSTLEEELSKKEKEFTDLKVKQKEHIFEINKTKRIIDFMEAKKRYQYFLDSKIDKNHEKKEMQKPKVFVKR